MSIAKLSITAAAAVAALGAAALPMSAQAQQRGGGIIGCDAPGGRQTAGAVVGGVLGGVLGNRVARNERTLGTVAGAAAGAAAGSYIGCSQQRARANSQGYSQPVASSGGYYATRNVRVRSGPGTSYGQVGSLRAGDSFDVAGSRAGWVQVANGGWVSANYVGQR